MDKSVKKMIVSPKTGKRCSVISIRRTFDNMDNEKYE
jgi:hypothetical protein